MDKIIQYCANLYLLPTEAVTFKGDALESLTKLYGADFNDLIVNSQVPKLNNEFLLIVTKSDKKSINELTIINVKYPNQVTHKINDVEIILEKTQDVIWYANKTSIVKFDWVGKTEIINYAFAK